MRQRKTALLRFGPFRLNVDRRLLLRGTDGIPLPSKAFETLLALIENRGRVVSKEDLMKRVWPDTFVEEGNLTVTVFALRKALGETPNEHRYILTVPGSGYRFVGRAGSSRGHARARRARGNTRLLMPEPTGIPRKSARRDSAATSDGAPAPIPPESARWKLEPAGGALAPDSEFYIVRPTDQELHFALARGDSIVLVKGARQVGKTSLLARGVEQVRQTGARVVVTDFQTLDAAALRSAETLYLTLAGSLVDQLGLSDSVEDGWSRLLSPATSFERFFKRAVLPVLADASAALVWALDEVDRLFGCDFGSDVFALFRSWHNRRALDPHGGWHRLTLAIAYATEAHLFITDLNQSPFNVGSRLVLDDFTPPQAGELNRRYGSPLATEEELARYFALVGGHPYLVHRGLYEMAARGVRLAAIESEADRDEGLFGDHLRRLLLSLSRDPALAGVVRGVLQGKGCPAAESFYRLRSAGLVSGDAAHDARPRCMLYARYLAKHLL